MIIITVKDFAFESFENNRFSKRLLARNPEFLSLHYIKLGTLGESSHTYRQLSMAIVTDMMGNSEQVTKLGEVLIQSCSLYYLRKNRFKRDYRDIIG